MLDSGPGIAASVLMIQRRAAGVSSGDDIVDHLAVNIGQAVITSAVAVGQLLVIQSHEGQDGGVQVMDMDPILNSGEPEIVRGSIAESGLDATAGHAHGEAVVVVISSLLALGGGSSSELTAPDHQGLIQQASPLEILDQGGDSLVTGLGEPGVSTLDVSMAGVPGDVVTVNRVG